MDDAPLLPGLRNEHRAPLPRRASVGQTDVDVILLDLEMPDMDGREVLRRVKDHPDWRATPVIVISGRQDMDGIIECIEAGADDYLFKPFNPVLLQARIKAGIDASIMISLGTCRLVMPLSESTIASSGRSL